MARTRTIEPAEYLSEAAVQERWAALLKPTEIKRARRKGQIAHYDFPAGPHYTVEDVQDYIERTYRRGAASCQSAEQESVSRSEATTSINPIQTEAASGTPAAMTPELAMSAAEVLKQQIMSRPRSRSPRSSQPAPKVARRKGRLALIVS